ncbi:MAG: hypothetical protein NT040_01335 [Bacteroidetes bacterium]|nr:hypothetical protein [Bacteroidota bacterium]
MKTRHLVFRLAILIMAFSACREITVTTTVNCDGTFSRMLTVSGDSSEAFKKELPYPVDTSWAMTSKKDTSGKGKFIVTYTKRYKDCEELKAEIGRDTSWLRQLVRQIDIRKRFGFFYSYVMYKEVYAAANPFTALPYKEYLTPEERLWLTRNHAIQGPSDSLKIKDAEEKALAYLAESATAEFEKILADGIRKLNDPRLDANRVKEFHDSISNTLKNGNFRDPGACIDSYRRWTGNSTVDRLKELQPPLFGEFNRKAGFLEHLLIMEGFHVETEMPGLITGTNSTALKGNRVSWDIFPMAFLLEDYTMEVESRIINVWAFVLSGLILLGLVSLLAVKALKR